MGAALHLQGYELVRILALGLQRVYISEKAAAFRWTAEWL